MSKRINLLLALVAELGILGWLYSLYHQVEQDILMVQGQYQERYADLHSQWLKLAGGIMLVSGLAIVTAYVLVRNWRRS
ncbi:hypothetical protein [Tumebacillus flagellatus]|uniref:Uncharacterized protein n=1 Tax=Tumebacillus flagellatus TaxID=1157490 RepID=A0A074LPU4_9BACL|nr:hypothetical protein [Tumebacillus flagellatus]KEO82520.1 hypothetical protein EL26_14900 [Tumebacillus flagellatus]